MTSLALRSPSTAQLQTPEFLAMRDEILRRAPFPLTQPRSLRWERLTNSRVVRRDSGSRGAHIAGKRTSSSGTKYGAIEGLQLQSLPDQPVEARSPAPAAQTHPVHGDGATIGTCRLGVPPPRILGNELRTGSRGVP